MKKKILFVLGTRPEAIKMMPIINYLDKNSPHITTLLAVTAQHREMLDQVLALFDARIDYDMNIMAENQTLFGVTVKILQHLEDIISKETPDLVMVQGDTTTTFVAGLAAFYKKIPVGHVEAGLRTADKYNPFPEEINRRLVTPLADLHFAPTDLAKNNLLSEGISPQKIWITGNTSIDALFYILGQNLSINQPDLQRVDFSKKIVLVTAHRRESFGKPLEDICSALLEIAQHENVEIIYPVHLNPNVKQKVTNMLGNHPNIHLIPPLDYKNFVLLMNKAYIILTDSGGVQEEAPSLGKPVLVLREVTERQEGIKAGTAKLVGRDKEVIVRETVNLLQDNELYLSMSRRANPYGDGRASEKIAAAIHGFFNERGDLQ